MKTLRLDGNAILFLRTPWGSEYKIMRDEDSDDENDCILYYRRHGQRNWDMQAVAPMSNCINMAMRAIRPFPDKAKLPRKPRGKK